MSLLGNLLWIIFGGGIFIFLEYMISGLLMCLTIIGIPFGIQSMKLSILGLFPFGVKIEHGNSADSPLSLIMNVIWILLGGIWISLTHVIFAILTAVTIIGIPFAKQHLKLARLAFTPFGIELR
ncbi:MAG: YccF domain-containing protein [Candidatus Marinimicrobia bacterium]|nr:YccF domain-containing protein [Candidatus Neomarinimicrobiota bacterium]MCF7828201.1 YccF domain-containing protein [Candidatus Neomarinimicrobiota bacterium]MCF7879624.1 YccF domain-containing protein [Candidatus Neomarinimicrobiota bacterium]